MIVYGIKKDYENEVKVFGVPLDILRNQLRLAGIVPEIKETRINIFGTFGGKKVKVIKRDKCVEVVRKSPHKKERFGKTETKKKLPTEIFDACMYSEIVDLFITVMELPMYFYGEKRRELYHLDENISIAIDEWVEGDLKGVSYIEVETVSKKERFNHIKTLFKFVPLQRYLPEGTDMRVTRKGTLGILEDFRKCKGKIDKLPKNYKKI